MTPWSSIHSRVPPVAGSGECNVRKEILVSTRQDETRAAVLEDGDLVEVYFERPINQRLVGNIYKGKVENVLPGMQAAFVNIGLERNAFLYVDDAVVPEQVEGDEEEEVTETLPRNLTIRDVLRVNQDVIVQVAKEPMGQKGARVTRRITLPGRYLVYMPTVDYVGVSRRIHDEKERDRLRKLAEAVKPPGVGVIVRTVAEGKSEKEFEQDMGFLDQLWSRILAKSKKVSAPAVLHRDMGLVYRVVRDLFSEEVERLYVDDRHTRDKVLDLLAYVSPHLKNRVSLFSGVGKSMFEARDLESKIEQALKRRVWLKSGGYIVIDHTEALTVIDVNTGKYVGGVDLADTVYHTNLEAAEEIAKQLRLRDIGGIIIVDFIDMEKAEHKSEVLRVLEEALKRDRTKAHVLGITQLGLVEMTRKKVRQGLEVTLTRTCPYCDGRGRVLSEEAMARRVRREIRRVLAQSSSEAILVEVHPLVASILIGAGGANLKELEKDTGRSVFVRGSEDCHIEELNIRALGTKGEIEAKALPVKVGDVLEVEVLEPHASNPSDGIARIEGYVIDIEDGGNLIGEKVRVEITKAFRTYARARVAE